MSKKIGLGRPALVFSGLYFIIFLIFYLPNYAIELPENVIPGYLIFRDICERLVQFAVPMCCVGLVLVPSVECGIKRTLLPLLLLSLPSLVYAVPYCYLYALSLGYDSIEGICISLPLSVCGAILSWLWSATLLLISRTVAGISTAKEIGVSGKEAKDQVHASLPDALEPRGMFDLSYALPRSIFAAGFAIFILQVVSEAVSAVMYLTSDGAYYDGWDILTIVFTFVFMLIELLVCHAVSYKISTYSIE